MFGFFHRNATSGITIGTVTTGNTASAEITPDGKLNLVLPAMSQQAEERLTAVETQLASVEQTAQGAADDAAALTTEIQDVRSDYAADIEAARSALQGSIDTVNATVSQHTTSISTAQRTAEAAQASASSLRGDVTMLQDDVQTAQSTANSAQSEANTAFNQAAAASAAAENALARGLEVIWHNPDDDGDTNRLPPFYMQNYSIDLSGYLAFVVVYAPTGYHARACSTMGTFNQTVVLTSTGTEDPGTYYYRLVTFARTQNKIMFGTCDDPKSTTKTADDFCIPLYIFGIKNAVNLPASA